MKKVKVRLDSLLIERGLVTTRQQAIGLILSGNILVDGIKIEKAGKAVPEDAEIVVKETLRYVGRGGLKLEEAIRSFNLNVKDKSAIDIGASTGGFTDCLLQHGAKKVYAVDVGYGQLHWRLRQDPRVINIEKTHILKLDWRLIQDPIDIATVDLSFISVTRIFPVLCEHLQQSATVIILVKPQFEVGKGEVGKGGIVRNMDKIQKAVDKVISHAVKAGFKVRGLINSP
ncbi:MAG TPA: TlyA family rRNA (cytidine-2'-O)-methyltransferase, partial [Nitrospiraceae bacterium]|nr:TlyA family rRNA (cytidine-2'-O)-methyltransferase [Nitrospiraceae bacterium]